MEFLLGDFYFYTVREVPHLLLYSLYLCIAAITHVIDISLISHLISSTILYCITTER